MNKKIVIGVGIVIALIIAYVIYKKYSTKSGDTSKSTITDTTIAPLKPVRFSKDQLINKFTGLREKLQNLNQNQ